MSSFFTYGLYGLCIRSELPLTAPPALETSDPDLTVHCGEELPPDATPPVGEVWAKADFGNGFGVQLTKTESGWSLFYPQTGEIRLTSDLCTATAHALPGKTAILPLLLHGSVPSWLLSLRGEPVLHASAVAVDGEALAFIGASGMGKSTLATLLCSAGASLVTDDVLRLQQAGKNFLCHWGTGELRLRPNAAALADLFPPANINRSVDGRSTLLLAPREKALPRLRAILIPQPAREQRELDTERLSLVQASFYLNGYPRVYGWQVDEPKRRQFALFARLAEAVPVFRVKVPWGPPFAADLPDRLFAAVGMTLGETAPLR
ncbi:MAG: hypothetical protein ABMA26_15850 [Limisphaerales bacterium]